MGYFDRKEELRRKAKKHTEKMAKEYAKETADSVQGAKIYSSDFRLDKKEKKEKNIQVMVDGLDTVSSLYTNIDEKSGKVAVLNFASYKNPGGMFLNGSSAQEECLCHESNLFNILVSFPQYYDWNRKHTNKSMYTNRAIYARDVVFVHDKEVRKADVITCAAPNFGAAARFCNVTREENHEALKERIRFVLDIAEDNQVNTLILGAFGCGVFGQDADEVANCFKELLDGGDYSFDEVRFSVYCPGGAFGNYKKMKNVLG